MKRIPEGDNVVLLLFEGLNSCYQGGVFTSSQSYGLRMKSTFSFLLERLAGEEKGGLYLDATRINQDVAFFRLIRITELPSHLSSLSHRAGGGRVHARRR